jgi:hypothetical protein
MIDREAASQIEGYARALRAYYGSRAFLRLGEQARDAGWSHEGYLGAVHSKKAPNPKPPAGSATSKTPTPAANSVRDWPGHAATTCSTSMKAATCRSPRTSHLSSNSSTPVTRMRR